jgi:hypothetical protein
MDFEQLFEGIDLPATIPTGGLGGDEGKKGMLVGMDNVDAGDATNMMDEQALMMMMMLQQAGGMNAPAHATMNTMEENAKTDEGMEDYSAFFNFGANEVVPEKQSDGFDLNSILGSTYSSTVQNTPLIGSSSTSLYTSFSTPALVPSSTATQLHSDFDDVENASPAGPLFPSFSRIASSSTQTGLGKMGSPLMMGGYHGFGAEPAFEDVSLEEGGLFGLPLFGGIPSEQQQSEQTARVQQQQQQRGQDFGAEPRTASPKEMFLPVTNTPGTTLTALPTHLMRTGSLESLGSLTPPSPLVELDGNFRESEAGKSRKPSLNPITAAGGGKKKKPYGPTGTRRSSRPLLDADAPTMSKSYVAPGATTRKLIPAGFQKKLKLKADEVGDGIIPETMEDQAQQGLLDEIEVKRRRNCVAARESRRRKMEYQNGLKDEIRAYRAWAEEMQAKLNAVGMGHLVVEMSSPVPEAMDLDE